MKHRMPEAHTCVFKDTEYHERNVKELQNDIMNCASRGPNVNFSLYQ